ncbi:MAG: BON domain-containing protein [Acidobacteriota bacterium]
MRPFRRSRIPSLLLPILVLSAAAPVLPARAESASRIDDAVITGKVKTAILLNRHLDSFRINVETENGVVTLKGLVRDEPLQELAGEIARSVGGVDRVVNDLKIDREGVELPEPRDRTFTQTIRDASITAAVKSALLLRRGIRVEDIHVNTHWGVVTLEGSVPGAEERRMVVEIAGDIWDVRRVIDRLEIKPDSEKDPAVSSGWAASDLLITSQVRTALALSRRVDGSAIRVEAAGGVVRLTGQVASQEEELAAVGLAESVWGVEEVISRLEIR